MLLDVLVVWSLCTLQACNDAVLDLYLLLQCELLRSHRGRLLRIVLQAPRSGDLRSLLEAEVDSWLPRLMEHIGQTGDVILTQQAAPNGMEMGTWRAMLNLEGGWTGKVLIQCRTKSDLYKLHRTVQNRGITIQGHSTSLNINSNYVDLGNYLSTADI